MGIDNTTVPRVLSVTLDSSQKYIKKLKDQAVQDGANDEEKEHPNMTLSLDGHSFNTDEYYFDEGDNELKISGSLDSPEGGSYLYLSIPLSDTVLIDIMQAAVKKLNKLKTAMESLN